VKNYYGIRYSRNEYRENYLTSIEWKEKSNRILNRDPICVICKKSKSNDTHHLTYRNIPFELDSELIGVCRKCHNIIHRNRELTRCSTFSDLKRVFQLSRKRIHVLPSLKKAVSKCSITKLRRLAGLLKIPASFIPKFFDTKKDFSFFKYKKIRAILDSDDLFLPRRGWEKFPQELKRFDRGLEKRTRNAHNVENPVRLRGPLPYAAHQRADRPPKPVFLRAARRRRAIFG
jgi:hypothetical protein